MIDLYTSKIYCTYPNATPRSAPDKGHDGLGGDGRAAESKSRVLQLTVRAGLSTVDVSRYYSLPRRRRPYGIEPSGVCNALLGKDRVCPAAVARRRFCSTACEDVAGPDQWCRRSSIRNAASSLRPAVSSWPATSRLERHIRGRRKAGGAPYG